MNQVILIGSAGKDPELKTVGRNNTSICEFSMATSELIPNTKDYKSTWHNIKCWAKTAEIAYDSIRKGDEVFVQGKIEQESWEDKNTGKKVYKAVIVANIARCTRQAGTGGGQQQQQYYYGDPGPCQQQYYYGDPGPQEEQW